MLSYRMLVLKHMLDNETIADFAFNLRLEEKIENTSKIETSLCNTLAILWQNWETQIRTLINHSKVNGKSIYGLSCKINRPSLTQPIRDWIII